MYFEIYDWDTLKVTGSGEDILNEIEWEQELMTVPTLNLSLPIHYKDYLDGREEIKVHDETDGKVFWGIVKDIVVDKPEEKVDLRLDHVISEWEYRQISVNNAVVEQSVNTVFKGDKVNKNTTGDESITANDFAVNVKDAGKITNAQLIEKAFAQAWRPSNGNKLKVSVKDRGGLKKKTGTYKITFAAPKGTSVTVQCEVKSNVNVGTKRSKTNKNVNPREMVTAHDFSIDVGEVEDGLTDAEILKISQAEAHVWHRPKQKITGLTVDGTVHPDVGDYLIGIVTPKGTRVNITVAVEELTTPSYGDLEPSVIDNLSDIYNDLNFAYPGWEIDWQDGSGDRVIDYVYSRQNKLEALTKTIELTPDLFWRVVFTNDKKIEIGKFGKKQNYKITIDPPSETNIQIIDEPTIDYDFENVANIATVYAEKSDTGMSTTTLREMYENKDLQDPKFPVVILRAGVNNERNYRNLIVQTPKMGSNNYLEYCVLDTDSIKAEGGRLIETTFSYTDLAPTNTDSKKITDAQRIRTAKTIYNASIRRLKHLRRTYPINLQTSKFPAEINVGDKVRLLYDNILYELGDCSNYYRHIMTKNDWFYVQKIRKRIAGETTLATIEIAEITLTKELKVDREDTVLW